MLCCGAENIKPSVSGGVGYEFWKTHMCHRDMTPVTTTGAWQTTSESFKMTLLSGLPNKKNRLKESKKQNRSLKFWK